MLSPIPAHIFSTIIGDLEGPHAVKVAPACFVTGEEGEYKNDFFRFWGRVVCMSYNHRWAMTTLSFVEGEDLELFDLHYPEGV